MSTHFKNLNVVEIASVLAGPSVGLFFAELGANVVKVENKTTRGDVTRTWKLPGEDRSASISAYYASVNSGKENILIDLKDENDRNQLNDLLKNADILIVNFKAGDAEKFRLDYASVKALNEGLIYGEITGFGEESDRVAYDLILQAESGFMSMNGTADSGPVKMPVALIDLLAGHQLKAGVLTALYNRDAKQLGGSRVSVSLYDAALASLANQATNWLMVNHIPQRIGSTHPNIAPYGELFTTADGAIITFAIGSDKQFLKLCSALEISETANDSKFLTNRDRVSNREVLQEILQDKVSQFKADQLLERLNKDYVPAARVKDMKEVFESPLAKQLIVESEMEGSKAKYVKSTVFKIS